MNGEGADPGRRHLLAVGLEAGISRRRCMDMMDEVEERVREMLAGQQEFMRGVTASR